MQTQSTLTHIVESLVALGTVAVAILAIWGAWFRDRLASPKLTIKLRDTKGNPTTIDGAKALYFHLLVQNRRRWALAKGVQVLISAIWRKAPDGTFKPEILAAELPLTWAFPQFNPVAPSIRDSKLCDFGYLVQGRNDFVPSLYFYPNNFKGFVTPREAVRFAIDVKADNFTPSKPYLLEVHWDGQWADNPDELEKHLVVKHVEAP